MDIWIHISINFNFLLQIGKYRFEVHVKGKVKYFILLCRRLSYFYNKFRPFNLDQRNFFRGRAFNFVIHRFPDISTKVCFSFFPEICLLFNIAYTLLELHSSVKAAMRLPACNQITEHAFQRFRNIPVYPLAV